jgi:hypothetical protein
MPISSIDDPATSSTDGIVRSRVSISTVFESSRPGAELPRAAARAWTSGGRRVIDASFDPSPIGEGRDRRQQEIEQTLLGRLFRFLAHLDFALLAHHLHRDLDEIAHHRLHVRARRSRLRCTSRLRL